MCRLSTKARRLFRSESSASGPSRTFIFKASQDLTCPARFARLKDAAGLTHSVRFVSRAEVAELADARGSGPRTRKGVGVRVPSSAPDLFALPKNCLTIL